ncbi:MAG TPA: glycosyltransferase family 4 protein [Pirellulaceae bacterium]|nr:glycosyltransferase family 4 protein [Pirellulaceae bacterium]HMO93432.1 glycosyltransferase family 4 protein [Pirellulaceae bacterium]HMP68460.1 glycosyltransferase family 4 protein [Pirellulaceae bacterium]
MKRAIILGAYPESVVAFRGDLIQAVANAGHEVIVMTAPTRPNIVAEIESLRGLGQELNPAARCRVAPGKVVFRGYPVQRNALNPKSDWRTLRELQRAFRELQPDVILAYTIKPIIWGGIAARSLPRARFVAMVTGLGYAFQGSTLRRRLLNQVVVRLYRYALRRADTVIFQNVDNRDEFIRRRIVPANKCHTVPGSGVNLDRFRFTPLPKGPPRFLLIARLLGEKGIREYAAAAAIVKQRFPNSRFSLVGPTDPSPDGIPLKEVERWQQTGAIEYHGATDDVRPYLRDSHIYCLPSYHEGMPRTVLEAMAMGRPILTTDVCGCRETVIPGTNGWLVPSGDANSLAERMMWFVEHREQWETMAFASRRLAEEKFDVANVNRKMLEQLNLGDG